MDVLKGAYLGIDFGLPVIHLKISGSKDGLKTVLRVVVDP